MKLPKSSPQIRRWLAVLAAGMLALQLGACAAEPSEQDAPTGDQEVETSHTTNADDETSAETATPADFTPEELDGALVASFPSEIPLYDGEISDSRSSMGEVTQKPEWAVAMVTGDSLETVDAAVRDAYSNNGWSIRSEQDFAGGYMVIANGNGYIVTITHNDFGGPEVIISYGVSAQ